MPIEFKYESDFEEALIKSLLKKGWTEVIKYPTEKDLINNWAKILFENNKGIDRLNECELTDGEMAQIIEQIKKLSTPVNLNIFINGRTLSIKRDNPKDILHFGKEVSLKIYDRLEIAGGSSRYQIAQQPIFSRKSKLLNDRRGDLMLLINGMPVIHIELKRSGVPVSEAYNQIEKYSHENLFTGLFSLIQIFVAMTPNETRYFANPGLDGNFNPDYYFKWADFNNDPINDWRDIASQLLSIPMAHQLIGFYTIADQSDGVLKVLRSYQYHAANAISDKVAKTKWNEKNQRGGFIWHTTGSGKTMTSFKSAHLISTSHDADKVIFLMDRIELGTQSLAEYRGFAGDSKQDISEGKISVQATENTYVLISKLKSSEANDTLIVTSIQKMSRIKDEDGGIKAVDIEKINKKRMVFIVDEAHRSVFGEMLLTIKDTFPNAIFFGFTGTPIHEENQKKMSTTVSVFGNELHRYSIADGIRDKNVLGFDPCKVLTFKDSDIRKAVALEKAKADTPEEAINNKEKSKIYYKYMNDIKMAGYNDKVTGKYIHGIEDFIPNAQYRTKEHQEKVVEDIMDKWLYLSRGGKFHAIFATSSIPEAIEYYDLIRKKMPSIKVTCLFDPNIDNNGDIWEKKEEGLKRIISDYNESYNMDFSLSTYSAFKKDIALRLAHKEYYKGIEKDIENKENKENKENQKRQLDILIVVDQMLTGFDSKWINTLYLDKMLEYENIIQAFSRTNRLFGSDKPFGTIRYYRRPHTMEENINKAVSLYSGNKPIGLFVDKLDKNIEKLNFIYHEIKDLFESSDIKDFIKLPDDNRVKAKFASLFNKFYSHLEAAKIQGFKWDNINNLELNNLENNNLNVDFTERNYLVLLQRYKEIDKDRPDPNSNDDDDIPYDLKGYITEIDTGKIDSDYMNSRFEKYLKALNNDNISNEAKEEALNELHKSFASLTQEEQKYANIFLHDVQRGDVFVENDKTLREYITEYMARAKDDEIHRFADSLGLDEEKLRNMMILKLTIYNINEFGRFEELIKSADLAKAQVFLEQLEGTKIRPNKIKMKLDTVLRGFILKS